MRRILKQAWPILITQWASIAFGVLDTTMTGHASAVDLAALALGISIYITIFIGLMGVMHALIPLQAQAFGAKKFTQIGEYWSQGIWVSIILSGLGALALSFPDMYLSLSGEIGPEVRLRLTQYLQLLILGLPAALIFRTAYALANAVSRPRMIMNINLLGVALKAFFNWIFIFGHLGAPAMGTPGAALASSIVYWISLIVALVWMTRTSFFTRFGLGLTRPVFSRIWEILRLGLPMGASYMIEVGAFTFMALIVAREGTSVTGAHQIVSNLAALGFMMPLSLSIATSALTAQAIGAQHLREAQQTGSSGMRVVFCGALITAMALYFGRNWIVAFYTADPDVAAIALSLLVILPWFHLIDALHCVNAYLLRAYKIAMMPLLIQAFSLTAVGLIGGWFLGFGPGQAWVRPWLIQVFPHAPPGAATMWIMASVGLTLSSALLFSWYRHMTRALLRTHASDISKL